MGAQGCPMLRLQLGQLLLRSSFCLRRSLQLGFGVRTPVLLRGEPPFELGNCLPARLGPSFCLVPAPPRLEHLRRVHGTGGTARVPSTAANRGWKLEHGPLWEVERKADT